MLLRAYLEEHGERQTAFAIRSGIPQQTVNQVVAGGGCLVETAIKIIEHTHGMVHLRDLVSRRNGRKKGAASDARV